MTLTVIIIDITNMIHLNNCPTMRSVQITLTPEQVARLDFRNENESISNCFIEHKEPNNE
jgi:hypothetical protein